MEVAAHYFQFENSEEDGGVLLNIDFTGRNFSLQLVKTIVQYNQT